jgi:hypothetical protein
MVEAQTRLSNGTKPAAFLPRSARGAATRLRSGVRRVHRTPGRSVFAALQVLYAVQLAHAAPCDAPAPIVFAHGAVAAEVTGATPRGIQECWTLEARAGQHLYAQVKSPGDNVVFQIYRPGSGMIEGTPTPGSKPLDNSVSEGKDARFFSGKLPETGAYLFVLGPRWGSSEYKLQVKITK